MKNRLLIVLGMVLTVCSIQTKDLQSYLLDDQNRPTKALSKLLKLTGIQHDGTLGSIVDATQNQETGWIRKEGTERWNIVDASVENRDVYFKLFKKLNLMKEIKPIAKEYEHALWLGAAFIRLKDRLEHIIHLSEQGVRFNSFVILGGVRPLQQSEKDLAMSTYQLSQDACPQTEADLMQLMYERTEMPERMRELPTTFIKVPMQPGKNGSLVRPTTNDTVTYWLATNPAPGKCLVTSNQPFVGCQDSVAKCLLPQDFVIDSVGQKSVEKKIGVYLDTLARNLYQEKKRRNL